MLQPKDCLKGYNKDQAIYKRHTSGLWKQIESEGMEKDIPGKWKSKEGWNTNIRIRKIKQTLK